MTIAMGAMCAIPAWGQGKNQKLAPVCIGFYNVENLFDTLDTPDVNDAEFTPGSKKQWNTERYYDKLNKLAKVIADMGKDVHPEGLIALGLAEVENRAVVEDLVQTGDLQRRGYAIVHYDSPDGRGIDVALIYQPKHYRVYSHRTHRLTLPDNPKFKTRDQLVVSGVLHGDTVHMVVAHWPSRRGGEKRSRPLRMAAAELGRHIIDSLNSIQPGARVLYMGDLNDDPVDAPLRKGMRAMGKKEDAVNGNLFNPMDELFKKGIGTLAWRDSWNLFDQILLTESLVSGARGTYKYYGARVFNKPYLTQADGNFEGYPFRTYVGDDFRGGYSDHFPVFVILTREVPENR